MEIVLSKDLFLDALGKAQGIVERRTVTPALSHVYLKAEADGTVTLSATDMDLSLRTGMTATVEKPGEVVISARKALEIVKEIDEPTIVMRVPDPKWMTITAGKSSFRLVTLVPEEFPPLPEPVAESSVTMDVALFQEIIRKTHFAASMEESRYAINGVLVEFTPSPKGTTVTAVATDGHRLALYRLATEGVKAQVAMKCLIPRRTLQECRRLFPAEGQEITIGMGEKGISFTCAGTVLMSRLIQGQFPDYQSVVVAADATNRAVMERDLFIHAIRRVSVMGDEKVRQVKLDFSAGLARVSSSHPELGEAVEEMPVEYDGGELSLAFNAIYVMEGLRVIDAAKITLAMASDFKPCAIKGEGDETFTYIVMPMRV